jgi:hypothetical protein
MGSWPCGAGSIPVAIPESVVITIGSDPALQAGGAGSNPVDAPYAPRLDGSHYYFHPSRAGVRLVGHSVDGQRDHTFPLHEVTMATLASVGNRCHYCGVQMGNYKDSSNRKRTTDHVIPRCLGGSDEPDNLAYCCSWCNGSKGGRTPDEWRESLRYLSLSLRAEHFDLLEELGVECRRPDPVKFFFEDEDEFIFEPWWRGKQPPRAAFGSVTSTIKDLESLGILLKVRSERPSYHELGTEESVTCSAAPRHGCRRAGVPEEAS